MDMLLLLFSALALTTSSDSLQTSEDDQRTTVADRLTILEHRLQILEAEKLQWQREKAQFESMKHDWEETKRQWHKDFDNHLERMTELWRLDRLQWETERDELRRTVFELKEIMDYNIFGTDFKSNEATTATDGKTSKPMKTPRNHVTLEEMAKIEESAHNVKTRADDTMGWEPVVDQMSQQLSQVTADIAALKTINSQQDHAIQDAQASVFVRWGRSVCPSSDTLVYSGVMGGSWFLHTGGPANYLCLSMTPVAGRHSTIHWWAMLYGAEYQTEDTHYQDNPPCAVCRSQHATSVMVPGTNHCPSGWYQEYGGYLMATATQYPSASEYICVDGEFEELAGGEANENGKLLHFTLAQCGSLPCPPYHNNTIVTCTVCSR